MLLLRSAKSTLALPPRFCHPNPKKGTNCILEAAAELLLDASFALSVASFCQALLQLSLTFFDVFPAQFLKQAPALWMSVWLLGVSAKKPRTWRWTVNFDSLYWRASQHRGVCKRAIRAAMPKGAVTLDPEFLNPFVGFTLACLVSLKPFERHSRPTRQGSDHCAASIATRLDQQTRSLLSLSSR